MAVSKDNLKTKSKFPYFIVNSDKSLILKLRNFAEFTKDKFN